MLDGIAVNASFPSKSIVYSTSKPCATAVRPTLSKHSKLARSSYAMMRLLVSRTTLNCPRHSGHSRVLPFIIQPGASFHLAPHAEHMHSSIRRLRSSSGMYTHALFAVMICVHPTSFLCIRSSHPSGGVALARLAASKPPALNAPDAVKPLSVRFPCSTKTISSSQLSVRTSFGI